MAVCPLRMLAKLLINSTVSSGCLGDECEWFMGKDSGHIEGWCAICSLDGIASAINAVGE